MAIGVRVKPELEEQLDQLAQRLGRSRSAYVREAIAQYLQRFGQDEEARRQSAVIATHAEEMDWSEQCPDWSDWTA